MNLNSTILTFIFTIFFLPFVYAEDLKMPAKLNVNVEKMSEKPRLFNINQATADELKTIPGMTSSKAKAIIDYRKINGNFTNISDISKIKGFKRMKADKLKAIQTQLIL